jgi:hypothetical protein
MKIINLLKIFRKDYKIKKARNNRTFSNDFQPKLLEHKYTILFSIHNNFAQIPIRHDGQ